MAEFMSLDFSVIQMLEYNINYNLLLEMLLNDIKNETVSFSTAKHLWENRHEKELLENLTCLQDLNCVNNPPENLNWQLFNAEAEYNEFIGNRARNSFLSNKVKAKLEGGNPTSYFCSLEKNFNAQKYISKLRVKDINGSDTKITNQSEIEYETKKYY